MTEGRTAQHTFDCPEAWDAPRETVSPWTAWTVTGSTCVNCPAPSTQSEAQWVATPSSCAAAQYGLRSWEREQTQSRSVSYNCPAGTTTLPPATYGSWGAWSDTGATRNQVNTCTNCPSPTTQTQNQWVATPSTCAAGQYGLRSWEREQSQSRSVSYNCPAGTTTLPAPTYGGWGAWGDTGATRSQVNTCTNCPAPSSQSQTQWVYTAGSCPAGQSGTYAWEREQVSTRSVSYNCPAGTGSLPPATFGSWSAWANTGATRNVVNTCAPSAPNCGGTPVEPTPICSFVIYAGAATSAANCSAGNYNWTPGSPTGYWCHLHLHIDPGYSCNFVTATACPAP